MRLVVLCLALAVAGVSCAVLERLRAEAAPERTLIGETPATVYGTGDTGLTVIVSHGFAGSRQMMEAISLTLARAGHRVIAFDYIGHGRHGAFLSPDVGRIEGTTQDLVAQTLEAAGPGPLALVGHSMATDVAVRAGRALEGVTGIAVISMYSEAVTEAHPARLLIVSGAQEGRLRAVALEALRQVGPGGEGDTVEAGAVARRAVVAPFVGHVGVLWSATTTSEIAAWLGPEAAPVRSGPWIAALLGALLLAFRPLAGLLPEGPRPEAVPLRRAAGAALVGGLSAAVAGLSALPLLGLAGFGGLALAFAAFGAAVLALLRPGLPRGGWAPGAALLLWALGAFALALDRYGAAFLPVGPRAALMAALVPAAVVFALADRALVRGRAVLARMVLRLPLLAALLAVMIVQAERMGLLFTVLPVLVLYWAVYGSMARWAEARAGPGGPALAMGVILAWSVAASTPLFAAP